MPSRYSEAERVAHVVRRCSMGVWPDLAADLADTDAALAAALDLSAEAAAPPELALPATEDEMIDWQRLRDPVIWWLGQMTGSRRLIEERLVWFWTDHFATGLQKVRAGDLMWRQHRTIRKHATGSFADLLRATAYDGAMLVYLDGIQNFKEQVNENYAREVMELHTLGRGNYTQDDIVEAARAFTGWVVNVPFRPRINSFAGDTPLFEAFFAPFRHDAGSKTVLGKSGNFGADDVLDILLDDPQTARFVGTKLYRELVGLEPDDATVERVAAAFRRDYDTMTLVEAIVSDPAFVSDDAVRAKVRTPLEKAVGYAQAVGAKVDALDALIGAFRNLAFLPLVPPNPAGYPRGAALLGPHQLVHTFDLAAAVRAEPPDLPARELLARFGLHDVADETVSVIDAVDNVYGRALLALGSPEYAVV